MFTLAFSSYALANLAAQQPSLRAEAAATIGQAIRAALASPVRQPFGEGMGAGVASPALPSSVLYLGHLNLMLGCHRQLVLASPYRHLHGQPVGGPGRALPPGRGRQPGVVPGLRWVPDNSVALASLHLHSQLTGSRYAQAGRRWVATAQAQLLDPATGLLASQLDAQGRPSEGPRGSSLGWGIWFLARFDPAFARQQYARYQAAHSTNLGVLRIYREQPDRYTTGAGDVDSGPLILGYGIPATAFALADAVALGDYRNAQRLRRVISLGSRKMREGNELRYGVRLVDLDVSPLSEALLWAEVPGGR